MKKAIVSIILSIITITAFCQNPTIRVTKPVARQLADTLPPARTPKQQRTMGNNTPVAVQNENITGIEGKIKDIGLIREVPNKIPSLFFKSEEAIPGKEFDTKTVFVPTLKYGNEIWDAALGWWYSDASIAYGRIEISTLPFPPFDVTDFSGIVKTIIVKAPVKDSGIYSINYNAKEAVNTNEGKQTKIDKVLTVIKNSNPSLNKGGVLSDAKMMEKLNNLQLASVKRAASVRDAQDVFKMNYQKLAQVKMLNVEENNSTIFISNQMLANLFNYNTDSVNYYIRIVPLNGRSSPAGNPTNTVVMKFDRHLWDYAHPKPPCNPADHSSDYTITNIEYVQAHFPERNCTYSNDNETIDCKQCVVVDKILDEKMNETFKQWGLNVKPGDKICPAKKKKSFLEKTFGGVTGFISAMVNGASKLYNDAKTYAKDKVKNVGGSICGDPCAAISGYAFDAAMVYCGIPPSIPNMDELTDKGLDYAIEMGAQQAGVDCGEECKDLIKKGVKDAVKESADKNFVNANNWYTVKPNPQGFYRHAYMAITVKKTGNSTYKKNYVCGEKKLQLIINNAGRSSEVAIPANEVYTVKDNMYFNGGEIYARQMLDLPFDAATPIGKEVTIIKVLDPQIIFAWYNPATNITDKFSWSPPNEFELNQAKLYNKYEYAERESAWQFIYRNVPVQFSFGNINVAPGVSTRFVHSKYTSYVMPDDTLD